MLNDYIQNDDINDNIPECPLPSDYPTDIPIHRAQLDQVHNLHGNLLTNTCKDFQLRILNERFLGHSLGYYIFL